MNRQMNRLLPLLCVTALMVPGLVSAASEQISTLAGDRGENANLSAANLEASDDAPIRMQAITPGPVPEELVVSHQGLDWVWASPCIHGGCSNPDPANQDGWRYATDEELLNRPACSAFGTEQDTLCASEYFDPTHTHCDFNDCLAGFIGSSEGQLCVNGQLSGFCESFYVRGESANFDPIPTMSQWAIVLLTGLIVLLSMFRLRQKNH